MLAKAGPSGDPIATPSVCWYIVLLKLNSTEDVALFINSTNTSFGMSGPLVCLTSILGMFNVNSFCYLHSFFARYFYLIVDFFCVEKTEAK